MKFDPVASLLEDLDTLAGVAEAGVVTRTQVELDEGETRPAAILFLDVVGFTALARALPSDQLARLIDRTFQIFEYTVKGHGGYCDKVIGDAGLYVFMGDPSHPPACESAIAAGLDLVDRSVQINHSLKGLELDLAVRVGVAFGDVTRQRVGGGSWQVTVMGDTVNIAQRLESSAEPGAVLTTNFVLDMTGDRFEVESYGFLKLKGFGEVETFAVTGEREAAVRLRSPMAALTPYVGREDELARATGAIREWWETEYPPETLDPAAGDALAGRNRLLVVSGPPGVGKSRLAYESTAALAASSPVAHATAHVVENSSLQAFAREAMAVAGLGPAGLSRRWEELCAGGASVAGGEYAARQAEHLPLLAYVLGSDEVDTTAVRQADPQAFLLSLKLALRACLELAALESEGRVVLVVEDVHLGGEVMELVSDLLANAALPRPLVVLGTARSGHEVEHAALGAGAGATVALERFGEEAGVALMRSLLPGLELPEPLRRDLVDKAEGLPYYYEEFARMLERRGFVSKDSSGDYSVVREVGNLTIPPDVRMLVLGRLDALPIERRNLLGRASVLGRRFRLEVLREMEAAVSGLEPGVLEETLSSLAAEGMLRETDGGTWIFQQVLTREAAYGALLSVNRERLHGLAATILAEGLAPGTADERDLLRELVGHLEAAGRPAAAHRRCCELLLVLDNLGHNEEWVEWEARARELWKTAWRERSDLPLVSVESLRAEAFHAHGQGRIDDAEKLYRRAHEMYVEARDSKGEAAMLGALAKIHRVRGRTDEAATLLDEALAICRRDGEREEQAMLLNEQGILEKHRGRPDQARASWERALAMHGEAGNLRGEAKTQGNLGALLDDLGSLDDARVAYERCLEVFRAMGDRRYEAVALNNLGNLLVSMDEADKARPRLERALALSREIKDPRTEGHALTNLGTLALQEGRLDDAEETLTKALRTYRDAAFRRGEGLVLANLGRLHTERGLLAEGTMALEEAEEVLEGAHDALFLGIVHAHRAHLALARGDGEAARVAVVAAQAIAEKVGARPQSELGRAVAKAAAAIEA